MKHSVRRIALFTKSVLFSIILHAVLLATLVASLWWPYSNKKVRAGSVKPIQAQVISAEEIQQQVDLQKKKIEEQQQIAKNLEELKIKQEQEKKKLQELEEQKKKEEKKQQELKEQKALAEEQLRLAEEKKIADQKKLEEAEKIRKNEEADKKKKQEAEERKKKEAEDKKQREDAKKKEEERKKKEEEREKREQEKKRIADEKKKIEGAEKKRKEAERKKAEDALKKQLTKEHDDKIRAEAGVAINALSDRIRAEIESNWLRPSSSIVGLKATIRVNLSRSGDVLSAIVVKGSGNQFFDRSAEIAVKKSSPLPFPSNPAFYAHINVIDLEFNPDDY